MRTQTVQLGEVCEFVYGEALKEENRRSGKVPVYGSNGVVGWHDKALTRGATIVIGRKGSIGEVNWSNGPCFPIDTTYYVETPERPCDLRWLYYTLLKLDLTRLNKSAAVPGLNRDDAYEQRIPFPDVPEQERIAALLDQADRLRRIRRYALELADTFLPAAFLEFFGDLDREPSRWDLIEFDSICTISEDTVDPKDPAYTDLPQISSEDIEAVSGDLGPLRTAREKGVISVNFLVQPGELLFSKIRPKLRKVAHPGFKALCSADIYPIRLANQNCNLSYLLFYLRCRHFSRIVARLADARSNIPKVNRDELSEQTIPLPPFPLQQNFAALVERAERLRAVQREALRQAEHLFVSLLSRAFSG